MKSYLVLGLGKFGKSVAKALYDSGNEVLAADGDNNIVQGFSRQIDHIMQAEITDESFLKSMDVKRFDAIVVAVGSNMKVGIMTTVLLKELGAKYILVKAQDDFEEKILYKVGADKVILPESDMAVKVAHSLVSDHFLEAVELSDEYSIVNLPAPASWCGKTVGALSVRAKYNINIIAIKDQKDAVIVPDANTTLTDGMILTVMGANTDLKKLGQLK